MPEQPSIPQPPFPRVQGKGGSFVPSPELGGGSVPQGPGRGQSGETALRQIAVGAEFSLAQTCGPAAWAGGRWPDTDWREGSLLWVGWDGERVAWRRIWQADDQLVIAGTARAADDADWVRRVLGIEAKCPPFADEVVEGLRRRFAGLRPYADGSLVTGVLTSIIGQSISVAAAAVTEWKLAARFAAPIDLAGRSFLPFPRLDQLAEASPALVRESGVTWRRAEAIVAIAKLALDGALPTDDEARRDPAETRHRLRALPLVGPWTAESALLWGVGAADAHPTGDVALLRAARLAFDRPELSLKELDRLAEAWQPARAWAARLLWTGLLGIAG